MIYLIRHADAVQDENDPIRPLSPRGCEQISKVCAILRKESRFAPAEIWHSPLVRSKESAELLVKGLSLECPVVLKAGLEPEDDPGTIAAVLEAETRDVAVVGHEPHLGVLSSLMVRGAARPGVYYPFPKAGVLALSREGRRWVSEWLARAP